MNRVVHCKILHLIIKRVFFLALYSEFVIFCERDFCKISVNLEGAKSNYIWSYYYILSFMKLSDN